jgi:hypothetical protein
MGNYSIDLQRMDCNTFLVQDFGFLGEGVQFLLRMDLGEKLCHKDAC